MPKGHYKVSIHCLHSRPAPELSLPPGALPAGILSVAPGRLHHLQHATEPRRNAGELKTGCALARRPY